MESYGHPQRILTKEEKRIRAEMEAEIKKIAPFTGDQEIRSLTPWHLIGRYAMIPFIAAGIQLVPLPPGAVMPNPDTKD